MAIWLLLSSSPICWKTKKPKHFTRFQRMNWIKSLIKNGRSSFKMSLLHRMKRTTGLLVDVGQTRMMTMIQPVSSMRRWKRSWTDSTLLATTWSTKRMMTMMTKTMKRPKKSQKTKRTMSHPQNKPICLIRSIQKEWKNLKIVWKSLFYHKTPISSKSSMLRYCFLKKRNWTQRQLTRHTGKFLKLRMILKTCCLITSERAGLMHDC